MEDKIKALEAAYTALEAKVKTEFGEMGKAFGGVEAQVAALSEQVATLTEQVESLENAKPGVSASVGDEKRQALPEAQSFKLGKRNVKFRYAAFFHHGEKLFAHKVAKDATLREEIAKEFPGLIEDAE